jgi:hypothetical protein
VGVVSVGGVGVLSASAWVGARASVDGADDFCFRCARLVFFRFVAYQVDHQSCRRGTPVINMNLEYKRGEDE